MTELPQPPRDLLDVLAAASIITGDANKGKKKAEKQVSAVLKQRLLDFHTKLGPDSPLVNDDVADVGDFIQGLKDSEVEETTAEVSLWVLKKVNAVIVSAGSNDLPPIGLRDLTIIRPLTALVFRWGVQPPMARLLNHWATISKIASASTSRIVEVAESGAALKDKKLVKNIADILLGFVTPLLKDRTRSIHDNPIARLILTQYVTGLLKLTIAVGWAPDGEDVAVQQGVDAIVVTIPTSQAMASLGSLIPQMGIQSLRSVCSRLLTQQLLQPDGVRGLCSSILGESSTLSDAGVPLIKLENIARVISTPPAGMKVEAYYHLIVPRILAILSAEPEADAQTTAPETHKRAAAFTISRMLNQRASTIKPIMYDTIHAHFFPSITSLASAMPALEVLQALFAHSDPSPTLPAYLLSPILPPLYALSARLDETWTADPARKELVKGLIRIWGNTTDTEEAIRGWWSVIQGRGGWGDEDEVYWEVVGADATVMRGRRPSGPDLRATIDVDTVLSGDANPLDLRPNPTHLVALLKSFDRKDVSSALFVRVLDEYQALNDSDVDPLRALLYLRLVLEMVEQLGSTALTQPTQVLSFVAHTLQSAKEPERARKQTTGGIADLRIVKDNTDDNDNGEDSDDEGPDDMVDTALNLLLATLEANESMNAHNTPLLQVTLSELQPLTTHTSSNIRQLALEARLVLTARKASTVTTSTTGIPKISAQETYQQALKLLQDPLLPVRAHGLIMLRQLISPPDPQPAFVPAVLPIFFGAIQEDDSYIFLNAVAGLVALAETMGPEVLKGLVRVYYGEDGDATGSKMSKPELDKRVRVGEALSQSIVKCGDTLGAHVDILIPPIYNMVRNRDLPIALRSSALSLLARCAETSFLAVLPWVPDLSTGMADLIQLEGVALNTTSKAIEPPEEEEPAVDPTTGRVRPKLEEIDKNPLSSDPKLAPFRRSAVHLLHMLLKGTLQWVYAAQERTTVGLTTSLDRSNFRTRTTSGTSSGLEDIFPIEVLQRIRLVLSYARSTDADRIVRTIASETLETLTALDIARLSGSI